MKKIIFWTLGVLAVLIITLVVFIEIAGKKKFDAPYPDIKASTDSALIERGRHLVYGPAHCATCHMPMDKIMAVDSGKLVMPLIGGWELTIPPGTFRAPNLTPDMETGIGKLTDGEIARTLRYSVGSDGRFIPPFMPFHEISDEDLTAIISFLRSQEPVKNQVPPSELTFLGKAVVAFGMLKPVGPSKTPPVSVAIDSTVEYGDYLVNRVANCRGCHTKRDMKTGAFTGPELAGGFFMPSDAFSEGYSFVTPNLTPEKTTGVMASWTEDQFIKRFRAGRIYKNSPMLWGTFSRMDDLELKAIYRYLNSLDPVVNKVEKTVYEPGKTPVGVK